VNKYKITISLKSNLHISSGFGFAQIIDHTSIEDAEGLAYIPGSTIKGKLKSVCKKIVLTLGDKAFLNKEGKICQSLESSNGQKEICKYDKQNDSCIICKLFGSPFKEGKLIFSDARPDEVQAEKIRVLSAINPFRVNTQNEIRTNVRLSRHRRISDENHLFVLKNVSKELKFTGFIYARENVTSVEEELLKYGLKTTYHLGGQKARGLGRINIYCDELGLIDEG
jgi:CRISPR type III-B/RAMP module RAMP protein Cmr6